MKKRIKTRIKIISILAVVIIGIFCIYNKKDVITYTKESTITNDLKLMGYFKDDKLSKYEISYYIKYESKELAKEGYESLRESKNNNQNGVETNYKIKGNKVLVKNTYTIKNMDVNNVNTAFETSNAMVTKEQFEKYAKSQKYKK